MMFEGLVSRQERNQLQDELCGDRLPGPQSMGNKLAGATADVDASRERGSRPRNCIAAFINE